MKPARFVDPHVLRVSDHVFQRYCPWNQGTVTDVQRGVSFTVTYDGHGRTRGEPRQRFTYALNLMPNFLVGTPPPDMLPVATKDDD